MRSGVSLGQGLELGFELRTDYRRSRSMIPRVPNHDACEFDIAIAAQVSEAAEHSFGNEGIGML